MTAFDIGQKEHFFEKGTQKFQPLPYSIRF